jgi:hypothetical protein
MNAPWGEGLMCDGGYTHACPRARNPPRCAESTGSTRRGQQQARVDSANRWTAVTRSTVVVAAHAAPQFRAIFGGGWQHAVRHAIRVAGGVFGPPNASASPMKPPQTTQYMCQGFRVADKPMEMQGV